MTIDFSQILYKEVLFNFDNNVFKSGSPIDVKMIPVMKYVEENQDAVIAQLTLEYHSQNQSIMKYAGLILFIAEGWNKLNPESDEFKTFKIQLWNQALGFFRGVVCEKLRGTNLDRYFVPKMPEKDIIGIPLSN